MQVITVSPSGAISGLDRKPGDGIDLKSFGRADVVRASAIEWYDGDERGYYVSFVSGPRNGQVLGFDEAMSLSPIPPVSKADDGRALWNRYNDCVAAEIAVLDADRLNGRF